MFMDIYLYNQLYTYIAEALHACGWVQDQEMLAWLQLAKLLSTHYALAMHRMQLYPSYSCMLPSLTRYYNLNLV